MYVDLIYVKYIDENVAICPLNSNWVGFLEYKHSPHVFWL